MTSDPGATEASASSIDAFLSVLSSAPAAGLTLRAKAGEDGTWECIAANSVARMQLGWGARDAAGIARCFERSPHRAQLSDTCTRALLQRDEVVELVGRPLRGGTESTARSTENAYDFCARALDDECVVVWIRISAGRTRCRGLGGVSATWDTLIAATNIGVWEWDVETDMTWRSLAFQRMLGYGPDDELPSEQESWEIRLHPDDHAAVQHQLHAHLFDRVPYEAEYRLRTKEGTFKWFRDYGVTIRDEFGNPLRVVGSVIDIDALKRSESDLETARRVAETASAAKSEFLANMSHEIRTPMTAIIGYAELLDEERSEQPLTDEERREHVATIRRNGQHLLELINDILDLSKIEANRLGIESVQFSVRDLLRDLHGMMGTRAGERNLEFGVRFATAIPDRLVSDPVRIRQIVVNLVGNALKFTHQGYVRLILAYDKLPGEAPQLRIRVEDTGIGISPTQLERLFSPFSQADSSTTREYGGTGLGLTISQRLAQLLGGRITVTSRLDVGSTFDLVLPVSIPEKTEFVQSLAGAQEVAAPAEPKPDPRLHRGHVLLVEDGPDNQRLIRRMLEISGVTVEVVDNGLEAIRRIGKHGDPSIDVIFMDMQMPVLDGYEATERLRADGWDLPIIALTAHAMSSDRERCLDAGCTDYTTKPIQRRTLVSMLAQYLPAPE